jgi:hypothetical protein
MLILIGAFVLTACAADDGQETAVEPIEEPMIPAASQDAPVTGNQEPTSILEKNPATEPPPSEAPSPTAAPVLAPLPVIAPAPSWKNDTWINTESPLLLEDLRNKVVLLEFWTFG